MWGATRSASSTPGVKRGFSACLYQGPRNWVVLGLLQGACQSWQCVPKKFARKRKAPEYGALVFLNFRFFSVRFGFQALKPCPMPVRGALKRCTVLKLCGDPNVGAGFLWEPGLPAMQAPRCVRYTAVMLSQASQLPHKAWSHIGMSVGLGFSPHHPHHHPRHPLSSPTP